MSVRLKYIVAFFLSQLTATFENTESKLLQNATDVKSAFLLTHTNKVHKSTTYLLTSTFYLLVHFSIRAQTQQSSLTGLHSLSRRSRPPQFGHSTNRRAETAKSWPRIPALQKQFTVSVCKHNHRYRWEKKSDQGGVCLRWWW